MAIASLIASKAFSSTPTFVEVNVMDKGLFNGISTTFSMSSLNQGSSSPQFATRSNCLNDTSIIHEGKGVPLTLPIVK